MTDSNHTQNNKRILKNTLMLYFRHILIMFVSLYTVRVVLSALGVEDYGLYNVVGGVVALFSFFNSTMASASQRFFSYAIGQGDFKKLSKIFSINWLIYGVIALIAFVLLETVGFWFVANKLVISPERLDAAIWVYHLSVLTFISSILSTPFMALIIAYEDMQYYAYISILEALLKLIAVFFLMYIQVDKLIIYGVLIFFSTFIVTIVYWAVCKYKYKSCRFKFVWNKSIMLEITSFTGWSVFGSVTVVLRNQAVTILLNQMFNPIVVAARSISMQVANSVNVFASNFNTGLYPPIVKSYASGELQQMMHLLFRGSKITYFLMFLLGLPLYYVMPFVMSLWLVEPPEGVVIFARLALVDAVITSVSLPLMTAIRATGRVKLYELSLGSILIVSFVVTWGILLLGAPAYSVMIIAIAATILMFIARLILLKIELNFPVLAYLRSVIMPLSLMTFLAIIISGYLNQYVPETFFGVVCFVLLTVFITFILMYNLGLTRSEKNAMTEFVLNKIKSKK